MIALEVVLRRFQGLSAAEIHAWLGEGLLRAEAGEDGPCFTEIDVERIGLILTLRDELDVGEAALPIILSLLDQLYAARRAAAQSA